MSDALFTVLVSMARPIAQPDGRTQGEFWALVKAGCRTSAILAVHMWAAERDGRVREIRIEEGDCAPRDLHLPLIDGERYVALEPQ